MSRKETIDAARELVIKKEAEYLSRLRSHIRSLQTCHCHQCLRQVPYWEDRYQQEADRIYGRRTRPKKSARTTSNETYDHPISAPEDYWAVPLEDDMIDSDLHKYIASLDIKKHWVLFQYNSYNIWVYYDDQGNTHLFDQDGDDLIPS